MIDHREATDERRQLEELLLLTVELLAVEYGRLGHTSASKALMELVLWEQRVWDAQPQQFPDVPRSPSI